MKQKFKNYFKIGVLLSCVLLAVYSCSDNEPISIEQSNVKYQPIAHNEAANFFNAFKSKLTDNKPTNNLNLKIDEASLNFLPIENTDLLMPVFKATTKNIDIISEVFLVKVEDTICAFLFNRIPYKETQTEYFSGIISITELNGHFVNGYRIENGIFVSKFVRFAQNFKYDPASGGECDEDLDPRSIFCNQTLGEVVISAQSSPDPTGLNFGTRGLITYTWNVDIPAAGGGTTVNPSGGEQNVFPCDDPLHGCDHISYDTKCPTGQVLNSNNECVTPCDTKKEDLKKVFPNTSDDNLQEIADAINTYGKDFGIDTKEKLQHFLAQAGHESHDFKSYEEYTNFNIKTLHLNWPSRFNPYDNPTKDPNKQNPKDYEVIGSKYANGEKLYNYIYNDAVRGKKYKMGNTNLGDGYKYRGRGIFQLTGKYNYQLFNKFYQDNYDNTIDLITNPELVSSNKTIAVISALWFYQNRVNIDIDSNTTVEEITLEINGGVNGLEDREQKFKNAKTNIN